MYFRTGVAKVSHFKPCSMYVSSLTMPASSTAKSAAVELGNVWAMYSSKPPVNPGSPGHVGHEAIARATDEWKSRTCERSLVRVSTLTRNPAVLPSRSPPEILHLHVGPLPLTERGHGGGTVLRR